MQHSQNFHSTVISSKTAYVWTASEEENPENTDDWARSARDIVKSIRKNGPFPSLCVAVDVTYPCVLKNLETMSDKEWDSFDAKNLFDQEDRTHCYIDGVSGPDAEKAAKNYS